jgi:hypothetical protein
VNAGELFVVKVGNVSSVSRIHDYLPSFCSFYIVICSKGMGELDVQQTIWDRDEYIRHLSFSLLTYHGLKFVGMHTIAFEPKKVGTFQYSLHLIANFTKGDFPHEAILDAGSYELKVVWSDYVNNIDDFKNTESIIQPVYVTFEGGKRYFGTVIGNETGDKLYPLEYKVYPEPSVPSQPQPKPATEILLLNAYPSSGNVQVTLDKYTFSPVRYAHGTLGKVYLQKGDVYHIGHDDDEATTYFVTDNVPYVNSTCIIIVDSGHRGELEHMMHCLNSFDKFVEGQSWLFTYSTVRHCQTKADVLFLGKASYAACHDGCCNRFYSVAHDLHYGVGMESHIDLGQYRLKVFEAKSVNTTTEFYDVQSVVGELAMDVGEEIYTIVVTGVCNSKSYPPVLFSFPSSHRFIDPKKQPRYSKFMRCGDTRIGSPYEHEYDHDDHHDDTAAPSAAGILSLFHVLVIEAMSTVIWLLLF